MFIHFPILFSFPVVYCGPTEWRFERRRGSSCDRKNTVRHLIQMMSISESNHEDETEEDSDENLNQDIPDEFQDLYKDEELRKTLVSSLPESLLKVALSQRRLEDFYLPK